MLQLTVVLVRNAESQDEGNSTSNLDTSDASVDADFARYIQDQAADERGRDDGTPTLSVRVDPELTDQGFEQAQHAMTLVIQALSAHQRKIAVFSAPLRTCIGTVMMLSCADIPNVPDNMLHFRLSSFEAAVAPAAIPVIVHNGLCNGDAQIARIAGYQCAVDAGLLHCAAHAFNDARTKCPMMKCFQRMKRQTQARLDEWDDARDAATGQKIHQVTAVQYFRLASNDDDDTATNNPWALQEMTPKCNVLIDYAEPKRYMLTPRQGHSEPKKHYKEWQHSAEQYVKEAVFTARQAGCDTVILVVPGAVIQSIVGDAAGSSPAPCCVATVVATVGDDSAKSIRWSVHKMANPIGKNDVSSLLPKFTGPVSSLMEPPAGQDPATANLPGSNKWAQFPPPEPEVLPVNYPKLPDFAMALEAPMPVVKPSAPQFTGKTKTKKKPSKF